MILRRMQVESWGCFANPVEIGPFGDGPNVLFGPNAAGKSTLLSALTRALADSYGVGGAEAQALRPWGRALAPRVRIEFAHGAVEYRLTKRFLDRPAALLEAQQGALWTRLAENEAADRLLRGMLRASAPGSGLSKPQHWGLAQVLWAPQGALALTPLSGDVVSDVQAALGLELCGPGGLEIEQRIEKIYLELFTPTGRWKSGACEPPAARLRRERAAAEEEAKRARRAVADLDAARLRIGELRVRHEQRQAAAARLEAESAQARADAASREKLVFHKSEREQRHRAAGAEHARIRQRIDAIRDSSEGIARAQAECDSVEAALPGALAEVGRRRTALETAGAALERAQVLQAEAREASATAALALRFAGIQAAAENLDRRIAGLAEAQAAADGCRTELAARKAPSEAQLAAIRRAAADTDAARIRLDSSLIALEITPVANVALRVIEGDSRGERILEAGRALRLTGSPAVEVEAAGFGRIRVTGPAGSAAEYRTRLAEAEARLHSLAAAFGTFDLGRLEQLREQAGILERRLVELEGQIQGFLTGASPESLRAGRVSLAAEVEEIIRREPSWAEAPPDAAALEEAARGMETRSEEAVRAAHEELRVAQESLHRATLESMNLETRRRELAAKVREFQAQLLNLRADGATDSARRQELDRAALDWDAQRAALEDLHRQLALFPPDAAERAASKEQEAQQAARERDRARDDLRDEEAGLRRMASAAPYSELARAEEQLASVSAQLEEEELRMRAIELLHGTVKACRDDAARSVPARVAEAATEILRAIAGDGLGRLTVSDALAPSTVAPPAANAPVSLTVLSGGEKEQVALAARLALAVELARAERQLVVLDDALTATDTARFERILDIVGELRSKLQFLILTCHPERWQPLPGVVFHDLERAADRELEARR